MTQKKLAQIISGSIVAASLAMNGCDRVDTKNKVDAKCKSTAATIVQMLQSSGENIQRSDINIPVESVSKETFDEGQYICVIKEVDRQTHGRYNIQMFGYTDRSRMLAYHITAK